MNNSRVRVTSRLLQRRARALTKHLPGAVAGDDRGVHQARVATRRLREAVPVLAAGLKRSRAGKAGRKIRRLTRALGTVRELDVTVSLLDGLAATGDLPRTAIEQVRAHVLQERERRRALMLERLKDVNTAKLDRRLASLAAALQRSSDQEWKGVLLTRLLKRAARLNSAIEAAGQMYAPEQLHQVRIAAKKLRYGLELAYEAGVRSAGQPLRVIKRSQDLLGTLHDLQILQSYIAEVHGRVLDHQTMHDALDAVSAHVEEECRHLHGRYVTSSGSLRTAVETTRGAVAAELTRPVRRRPVKMVLSRRVTAVAAGRQ